MKSGTIFCQSRLLTLSPTESGFTLARRELERDLTLGVHHEKRGERLAGFGDELVEQVALPGREDFLRLFASDRLLQNLAAEFERAALLLGLRFFAQVTRFRVEDRAAALGAFADGFLAGEINLRRRFFRRAGLRLLFARHKFKSRAAILHHQERLELALGLVRDESLQQIRFAFRE